MSGQAPHTGLSFISASITMDEYDRKCHQLKDRQYQISDQFKKHLKADEAFKITVNAVFSIASMAYELLESSKIEQKRKLINYVFTNLELEGVTLRYSLRKPFDLMTNCTTHSEWLGLLDTLRTPAYYNYLSIDNTIFQEYSLLS